MKYSEQREGKCLEEIDRWCSLRVFLRCSLVSTAPWSDIFLRTLELGICDGVTVHFLEMKNTQEAWVVCQSVSDQACELSYCIWFTKALSLIRCCRTSKCMAILLQLCLLEQPFPLNVLDKSLSHGLKFITSLSIDVSAIIRAKTY